MEISLSQLTIATCLVTAQPRSLVKEIVALPLLMPDNMPELESIAAIPVSGVLHIPCPVSDSVVVVPVHTISIPDMGAGGAVTVISCAAVHDPMCALISVVPSAILWSKPPASIVAVEGALLLHTVF